MIALNMTMASPGFAPCIGLTLVGRLAPDVLQAAPERFPGDQRMDSHQWIVFGIQSGVAILDIEKAHLSHVQLLRSWLMLGTCFSDSKASGGCVLLEMP